MPIKLKVINVTIKADNNFVKLVLGIAILSGYVILVQHDNKPHFMLGFRIR